MTESTRTRKDLEVIVHFPCDELAGKGEACHGRQFYEDFDPKVGCVCFSWGIGKGTERKDPSSRGKEKDTSSSQPGFYADDDTDDMIWEPMIHCLPTPRSGDMRRHGRTKIFLPLARFSSDCSFTLKSSVSNINVMKIPGPSRRSL